MSDEREADSAPLGERREELNRLDSSRPFAALVSDLCGSVVWSFLPPKNLGDALERPLVASYLKQPSASFSSLPFSWLPLFLFSLPFFMENVAVVFYCN
jgi:hypothetical protein